MRQFDKNFTRETLDLFGQPTQVEIRAEYTVTHWGYAGNNWDDDGEGPEFEWMAWYESSGMPCELTESEEEQISLEIQEMRNDYHNDDDYEWSYVH